MSRAPYRPTPEHRKTVRAMSSYGVPQEAIAGVVGCSPHTLRKHFRSELDNSATEANAMVAQGLFRAATEWMMPVPEGRRPPPLTREAVLAMMFWLKTRARWSDRVTVDGAIQHNHGKQEVSHTLNAADREALGIMAGLESSLSPGGIPAAGLDAPRSPKAALPPRALVDLAAPRGPGVREN